MSKWEKLERDVKNGKKISILAAYKSITDKKTLASLAKQRDLQANWNQEKYNLGMNWFESGLPLDEAPDECKNDSSFIVGFNVAKRKALAIELEKEAKHR